MPKEYLEKIEWPKIDNPKRQPYVKPTIQFEPKQFEPKQFKNQFKTIRQCLNEIEIGTSNLVSHAIYTPKGKCPALVALVAAEKNPTETNIKNFLNMTVQDFTWKVGKHFAKILSEVHPDIINWIRD